MGELSIQVDSLKSKFSISRMLFGDKMLMRRAHKIFHMKLHKDEIKERTELQNLNEAIAKREIDTVENEYDAYCDDELRVTQDIIEGIRQLLVLMNSEITRLQEMYKEEDRGEFKDRLKKDLQSLRGHADKWFREAERLMNFKVIGSDEISLSSEIDHLTDPMNLQRKARYFQKHEVRVKKLEESLNSLKRTKYSKGDKLTAAAKELMKSTDKMDKVMEDYLSLMDTLFLDIIKILRLSVDRFRETIRQLSEGLNAKGFPLALLEKKNNETNEKLEEMPKSIISGMQGLLRIVDKVSV
ncbi:hypothetical protein JW711_02185 [Candidatus Woesearchaeota archaeon]|nr:hypothetical protein [Candidatus Woesearchaeota archaeon]